MNGMNGPPRKKPRKSVDYVLHKEPSSSIKLPSAKRTMHDPFSSASNQSLCNVSDNELKTTPKSSAIRPKNEYVHIDTKYHYNKPVWEYHRPAICVSHRVTFSCDTDASLERKKMERIQAVRESPVLLGDEEEEDDTETLHSEMDEDDHTEANSDVHDHQVAAKQPQIAKPTERSMQIQRQQTAERTQMAVDDSHSAKTEAIKHYQPASPSLPSSVSLPSKHEERRHESPQLTEEETRSSLCTSFMNNSEFACFAYSDRQRLSRMKLALLYLKVCIAVLRPNSPTFPKQNELHRWLDSKNHPPLTRIDIRLARKALKDDYNMLLHSNSNKLTDEYTSLYQAQEAMKNIYETAKSECDRDAQRAQQEEAEQEHKKQKEEEGGESHSKHDDAHKRDVASDIGSLLSDCSVQSKTSLTKSPTSPIHSVGDSHQQHHKKHIAFAFDEINIKPTKLNLNNATKSTQSDNNVSVPMISK